MTDTKQKREFTREYLDSKIEKQYAYFLRGHRNASDNIEVLQDIRQDIFGERYPIDLSKKPAGAGRMIF